MYEHHNGGHTCVQRKHETLMTVLMFMLSKTGDKNLDVWGEDVSFREAFKIHKMARAKIL